MSTSRTGELGAVREPDDARVDGDVGLVDAVEPRRHRRAACAWISRHGVEDGVPHEHGRLRDAEVCWSYGHDRGVAHDDRDPLERRPELLARELREDRPRALPHVGGPGVHDDGPVGEQPDDRRTRGRSWGRT